MVFGFRREHIGYLGCNGRFWFTVLHFLIKAKTTILQEHDLFNRYPDKSAPPNKNYEFEN